MVVNRGVHQQEDMGGLKEVSKMDMVGNKEVMVINRECMVILETLVVNEVMVVVVVRVVVVKEAVIVVDPLVPHQGGDRHKITMMDTVNINPNNHHMEVAMIDMGIWIMVMGVEDQL